MGCSVQRSTCNTKTPILVTGATGHIASHCINILLKSGYKVRGTVRSLANKDKYKFLYDLAGANSKNLTLLQAELQSPESWKEAVKGCEYILHIASPFPSIPPKDENELIKPAVEGTVNVLNAALEAKCKKVVITSSIFAMWFGNFNKVLTEEDWANPDICSHYPKSKVLAERAAWEFYEKHKDKIQITVLNPGLALGPTLTRYNNNNELMMAEILSGRFPGLPTPEITYTLVDIRDVTEAHIKALFKPETNGKRYILAGQNLISTSLVEIMREKFEPYGYSLPKTEIGAEEIKASGNLIALKTLGMLGKKILFNNERSIKDLGLKYHTSEEAIIDMSYTLIKYGAVDNKGVSV